VNGFIDDLYTPLGTTSNQSAVTDLHTIHIATAHAKPQSVIVSPNRFLVTDLNNGDSSASLPTSVLSGEYSTAELNAPAVMVTTSLRGSHIQKLYFCVHVRCRGNMLTKPLPRNGRCLQSRRLATGLYDTVSCCCIMVSCVYASHD
jgi:hypothetical protein